MHPSHLRHRNHSGFSAQHPPHGAVLELTVEHVEASALGLTARASEKLVTDVVGRLWGSELAPRLALVYGGVPLYRRELGVGVGAAARLVVQLRRDLCRRAFQVVLDRHPDVVNPLGTELEAIEFGLDGYHVNRKFMGDGPDFASNKQLHFDIVEPLGSNLYGPNRNMTGGLPVFADAKSYCAEQGIDIVDVLDKIPGTRNLTLDPAHYPEFLSRYAVAFDVDMTSDTPFTIFVNRVREAGLVHGATEPTPADPEQPSARPLLHYAFDNVTDAAAAHWYAALGQDGTRSAGDTSRPKPLYPAGTSPGRPLTVVPVS